MMTAAQRPPLKFYAAPMEGVTTYLYRTAHRDFFPGADRYFSPFLTPKSKRVFSARERADVLPEHNRAVPLTPQLLTKNAEDFLRAAQVLRDMGYDSVNLNLGCPSGTVVAKGKGAGFLGQPDQLDRFLEEIFARSPLPISVKTRIGLDCEEEWDDLMPVFNRYPIQELILHPRLAREMYRSHPHMDVFQSALRDSRNPVVYNGDLFTPRDVERFHAQYPQVHALMLGRGLIANPALIQRCQGGPRLERRQLWQFHCCLMERYQSALSGEHAVLCKMKELWAYMLFMFEGAEKYGKWIRKAQSLSELQDAVDALCASCPMREQAAQ